MFITIIIIIRGEMYTHIIIVSLVRRQATRYMTKRALILKKNHHMSID